MAPGNRTSHQDGGQGQAEEDEEDGRAREVAQADEDARAVDDDPAVLEPDQGDEEADADGDAVLEGVGHGGDDLAPDAGEGQDDEDDARR